MDKKEKLLQKVKWIDKMRWESETHKNLISQDIIKTLSPDQRILVHWLCYITDRQKPFEDVWKNGSVLFAVLIKEFCKSGYQNIWNAIHKDEESNKWYFYFKGYKYSSRFITTDILSIFLTFLFLSIKRYNKNKVKYISDGFNDKCKYLSKQIDPVNLIAFLFHLLAYHNVKNFTKDEVKNLNIKSFIDKVEEIVDENIGVLSSNNFELELCEFYKNRFFGKKRTWCCVRDYLKNKEFNGYFVAGLKELLARGVLMEMFSNKKYKYLNYLELPGDVWNVNDDFIKNLVTPNMGTLKYSNIPRSLREALKSDTVYPEQFDFSFDFVPRMCSHPINLVNQSMCKICLFGLKDIEDFCHENKNKKCPVTAIYLGYVNKCNPTKCPFKKQLGKGMCSTLVRHF